MSTADDLLAFEHKFFGPDRHDNQVAKGRGSAFANAPSAHRVHHAALEALIAAEKNHEAATAAESAAHTKLQAAIARVEETGKAIDNA